TREILTPDAVLAGPEHLTKEERALRERLRVTSSGFTSFEISHDGASVVVVLSGRLFVLDRASGKTHELAAKGAIDPRLSPDGKETAALRCAIVPAAGGAPKQVEWDRAAFPYVATGTWDKGGPPTLTVLDRTQKTERLLAIDRATGKTRVLVEEKDEAWVNV